MYTLLRCHATLYSSLTATAGFATTPRADYASDAGTLRRRLRYADDYAALLPRDIVDADDATTPILIIIDAAAMSMITLRCCRDSRR